MDIVSHHSNIHNLTQEMFVIFASLPHAFLSLSEGSQQAGQPAPALFSSLFASTHTHLFPSKCQKPTKTYRTFSWSSFSFALVHVMMDSGLETCSPPSTPRTARNCGTSVHSEGHPSGFASQVLRSTCAQCPAALSRCDRVLKALHFG